MWGAWSLYFKGYSNTSPFPLQSQNIILFFIRNWWANLPPQKETSEAIYSTPLLLELKNINPEMLVSEQPKVTRNFGEKSQN